MSMAAWQAQPDQGGRGVVRVRAAQSQGIGDMLIATNLDPTSKPDVRIALGPGGSQTASTPPITGGGRATVWRSGVVGPISSNK